MFTLPETLPTFVMPAGFLNVLNMGPLNGPSYSRDASKFCIISLQWQRFTGSRYYDTGIDPQPGGDKLVDEFAYFCEISGIF